MDQQFYLGTRKGLFGYEREGGGWKLKSKSFEGVAVPMLLPDPRDGKLYAAVEHGHFGTKLHCSEDAGQNWKELPVPAYPEKPDDAPEVLCPVRQIPIPWALEKIWAMEAGGADQPGVLWCGTIPGGLFRSENGGMDWELNRPLWDRAERGKWFGGGYDSPGIHSICVDPRDSAVVRVGVSCGGVWATNDGGENWECKAHGMHAAYMPPEQAGDPDIQDPHRMVQCRDEPDVFWVQHHNGVFKSEDACESWRAIETVKPADFGFGVAVDPRSADRVWLVPGVADEMRIPVDGRFVVSHSADGGESFLVLQNGLPQTDAYHLVYRHALEISPDGRALLMGSTTGSVWTSDDGGLEWERLTSDLPPIYCCRFV